MKHLFSIFIVLFFCVPLSAEVIIVEPTGDYATIDAKKDYKIVETLKDTSIPYTQRQQLAIQISRCPGSYNPCVLCIAVPYFLDSKEFDKAAILAIGGVHRTGIDAFISKDASLKNVSSLLLREIGRYTKERIKSKSEMEAWTAAIIKAYKNFEAWDRSTPRNYDDRWIRLHSIHAFTNPYFKTISKEEKQEIIEYFYKTLSH